MRENIRRIDFETHCCNSDGEPLFKTGDVAIIYNTDVISTEEVEKLIDTEMYEYDSRLVVTTQEKANNMKDPKAHPINMYEYSSECVHGVVFGEDREDAWRILRETYSYDVYKTIKEITLVCDNIKNGLTVTFGKE